MIVGKKTLHIYGNANYEQPVNETTKINNNNSGKNNFNHLSDSYNNNNNNNNKYYTAMDSNPNTLDHQLLYHFFFI
jgi:hypothetical protein